MLSLLLLLLPALAHSEPWWDAAWQHRIAAEVRPPGSHPTDPHTAHVRVPTGGLCQPRGYDIRVLGPGGQLAPHFLLHTNPSTYSELYFEVSPKPGIYWIYFGNPKAPAPDTDFQPRCGLTLHFHEAGAFATSQPVLQQSWEREGLILEYRDFAKFVERRGKQYAALTWPKIELDHHPFGANTQSILVFHGWLQIPASGDYLFTIASDDPAAIVLRGTEFAQASPKVGTQKSIENLKLEVGENDIETAMTLEEAQAQPEAAQKTVLYFSGGRKEFSRSAHGRATYTGKISLKQGTKELFYYQALWQDLQFAALAWQPPAATNWVILDANHFVQPLQTRLVDFQSQGNPAAAAFTAREINTLLIDQHTFIEVEFEVVSPHSELTYAWNFGDGVDNVAGPRVNHIYLLKGSFPVTLTATLGGQARSEFKLTPYLSGTRHLETDFDKTVARYAEILQSYPFHQLPTPYFQACMTLFEKIYKKPQALVAVLQAYVDTHTPRKEPGEHEGEFFFFSMPARKRISQATYRDLRDALLGFTMHLAHWQRHPEVLDTEAAIRSYRRVLELYPDRYPAAAFNKRAETFKQIGRTHLEGGKREQALATFRELEEDARDGFREWQYHGGSAKEADSYRHWIRFALIGQADVALRQGDFDRMTQVCEQADKEQRKPLKPAIASTRRTTHQTTVEDFIRRSWPEEALESIDLWEIEFPKDKLKGLTEFLRSKAYFTGRALEHADEALHLAQRLLDPKDPIIAEARFLEADIDFWSRRPKEAASAYKDIAQDFPSTPWAELALRRLATREASRLDLGDEPEYPYLVEHVQFRIRDTLYPLVDTLGGWGGHYRVATRHCPLTYEFPVRSDTSRLLLRFRKKGILLLEVNGRPFWQEPHDRRDEDVVDLELLLADATLWSSGKIRITFRDGLNYWPYWDPVNFFIDWLELHQLELKD